MANSNNNSKRVNPSNKLIVTELNGDKRRTVRVLLYNPSLSVIYSWRNCTILEALYPQLLITNRVFRNLCYTTACYNVNGSPIKLTSYNITKLIGNNKYKRLLTYCENIKDIMTKVRLILALLTEEKKTCDFGCQTDMEIECGSEKMMTKNHLRKPVRKPYVVMGGKVPLLPQVTRNCEDLGSTEYPNLSSIPSISSEALEEAEMEILDMPSFKRESNSVESDDEGNIDDVFTNRCFPTIKTFTGAIISVPTMPHSIFHLTVPDIMKHLTVEDRRLLTLHQGFVDWKYCLDRNEDGLMLIHIAVLNNDFHMAQRQVVVLAARGSTVDVMANGMTPLQMALSQPNSGEIAKFLIEKKADLLLSSDGRTALHSLAVAPIDVARFAFDTLLNDARTVLQDNEALLCPDIDKKTDEELKQHLMMQIGILFDKQGYNPLMLACRAGNHEVVELILELCPLMVDVQTPNYGKTALVLAIEELADAMVQGKNEETYKKTIQILISYNADPNIPNNNGNSVNEILAECRYKELRDFYAKEMSKRNSPNNQIGILNLNDGVLRHEFASNVNKMKRKQTQNENVNAKVARKDLGNDDCDWEIDRRLGNINKDKNINKDENINKEQNGFEKNDLDAEVRIKSELNEDKTAAKSVEVKNLNEKTDNLNKVCITDGVNKDLKEEKILNSKIRLVKTKVAMASKLERVDKMKLILLSKTMKVVKILPKKTGLIEGKSIKIIENTKPDVISKDDDNFVKCLVVNNSKSDSNVKLATQNKVDVESDLTRKTPKEADDKVKN